MNKLKLAAILLATAGIAERSGMAQTNTPLPVTNTSPAATAPGMSTLIRGTISSVDTTSMTLTLKVPGTNPETKVKVTSTTKITKDREPGTFSDATVGLRVSGFGKMGDDGIWTANILNIMKASPQHSMQANPN